MHLVGGVTLGQQRMLRQVHRALAVDAGGAPGAGR